VIDETVFFEMELGKPIGNSMPSGEPMDLIPGSPLQYLRRLREAMPSGRVNADANQKEPLGTDSPSLLWGRWSRTAPADALR
jgi:hypothetical protein